ncbi:MAG: response regulator [Desulfatibacillaceae bacterium]
MKEEQLLKKLREAFRTEAGEWLSNISSSLLHLEKAGDHDARDQRMEEVLRDLHSLKGAARAASMTNVESLCQRLEDVGTAARKQSADLSPELFDELHATVALLESMVFSEEIEGDEARDADAETRAAMERLAGFLPESQAGAESVAGKQGTESAGEADKNGAPEKQAGAGVSAARPVMADTVRIATAKLDTILHKAEELVSLKLVSSQHVSNLKGTAQLTEQWEKTWARVSEDMRLLRKQDREAASVEARARENARYARLFEFLEWNEQYMREVGREIHGHAKAWEHDDKSLGRFVDDLLEEVKQATMLPFSTLLDTMPRMVREVSRKQGKEVDLEMFGGDIEIDRRILEQMKTPFIHLLRNAVDHGVESAEVRDQRGKPFRGTVRVEVTQEEGGKVEIVVTDDGGGIDADAVREKAVAMGVMSADDAARLTDGEAVGLIFRSELSTSPIITEISGRGLGMAIVQEKVEDLGGLISLHTDPGRGTTIRMVLPVTLATFRGILVTAGQHSYVVPAAQVERVVRIQESEVKTVENRATIPLDNRALSLVDLCDVLGTPRVATRDEDGYLTVVVLGAGEKRIAYRVDEILSEQEVVVKSLGRQLARVPNIAGATILGSGKVVPVLNVSDLMKSSRGAGSLHTVGSMAEGEGPESGEARAESPHKAILVVEDSITSRMLIKNILESAGYAVRTAVDGKDALTVLKTDRFDAVISDVEMPRMNGFELTENIRQNERLAELPVVLVTSLDSGEDRERGIDAGANAYIVKSNFDQSDLLEVVSRLV